MRHKVDGRLFGRPANQRKALLRGLVSALFENQRIETTVAKAKEARRIAERMITFGIKGDLHSKRQVMTVVTKREICSKLFDEIAPRFVGRNGGYLRLVQTRNRLKDSAPMAILEFIDYESVKKPKGKAAKEAGAEKEVKKSAVKAAKKSPEAAAGKAAAKEVKKEK
ncbi:MAG: 50S ribosomal protein L17 [Thermodesulfovibrionales bacterium]